MTATAGAGSFSYTGGSVDASSGCTISVDVTSSVVCTYNDTTETVTSDLGASAAATATLTVDPATDGRVTFVQNSDTDGSFTFTSTEALLTFPLEDSGGTGTHGPVSLIAGTYVVTASGPTGVRPSRAHA